MLGANFTFDTDLGPVDLLAWIEPLGTYESVIGPDDLLAVERYVNRPTDQVAALQLDALKRLRDAGQP